MTAADWYFDFISPYSYFASLQLHDLSSRLNLRYRPVLFAGLLNHWEQKGPAEIPEKRRWTYRWCTWWAQQHGIPFRFPQAHPFNPISYLRLALAANCSAQAIHTIFARCGQQAPTLAVRSWSSSWHSTERGRGNP